MANGNTGGGISRKQKIRGFGLCFLGIWFLLMAGMKIFQENLLDEVNWLTIPGKGSVYLDLALGLLFFVYGRQVLRRPSVTATPSKPDDDSSSTE